MIWERFPKFVLGFAAASVLMTLIAESHGAAGTAASVYDWAVPWLNKEIKTFLKWAIEKEVAKEHPELAGVSALLDGKIDELLKWGESELKIEHSIEEPLEHMLEHAFSAAGESEHTEAKTAAE